MRGTACLILSCLLSACVSIQHPPERRDQLLDRTSTVVVLYDNELIEGSRAIWKAEGIPVDGFRHATVFVEHQQAVFDEEPLQVGVGFAPWQDGRSGARGYADFTTSPPSIEDAMARDVRRPTWLDSQGGGFWHGPPHNKTSFGLRVPIMGPYMWVYPLNYHDEPRRMTIVVYLTP